jgi:citrate lyase subunit beta/citryl-CoA lyase
MIRKSVTLGADSVILDLEDSVPPDEKRSATQIVKRLANELDWGGRELCVRINSPSSKDGHADLSELRRVSRIDAFIVPKAETDLSTISKSSGKKLIPLIETAMGLLRIERIVRAGGVVAVSYGAADFATSVDGSVSAYLTNTFVKTLIVTAAKAYGVEAIDNVFFDLKKLDEFRRQSAEAKALGYTGKQVIHPSQIELANAIFSPSNEDLEWANEVRSKLEEAKKSGLGAIRVDDRLVDEAHYRMASKILERRKDVKRSKADSKSSRLWNLVPSPTTQKIRSPN